VGVLHHQAPLLAAADQSRSVAPLHKFFIPAVPVVTELGVVGPWHLHQRGMVRQQVAGLSHQARRHKPIVAAAETGDRQVQAGKGMGGAWKRRPQHQPGDITGLAAGIAGGRHSAQGMAAHHPMAHVGEGAADVALGPQGAVVIEASSSRARGRPMASTSSRSIGVSPPGAPYRGQTRTTANPNQPC
jgi:hypothetical protein